MHIKAVKISIMRQLVGKVLIIDDDKATNVLTKRVVNRHQAFGEVMVIQNAQSALDYLLSIFESAISLPELIFLDINMPYMNGWEFLNELEKVYQKFAKEIKIILLSTSSIPEEKKFSTKYPMVDDFIKKPLSQLALDELVDKHFCVSTDN